MSNYHTALNDLAYSILTDNVSKVLQRSKGNIKANLVQFYARYLSSYSFAIAEIGIAPIRRDTEIIYEEMYPSEKLKGAVPSYSKAVARANSAINVTYRQTGATRSSITYTITIEMKDNILGKLEDGIVSWESADPTKIQRFLRLVIRNLREKKKRTDAERIARLARIVANGGITGTPRPYFKRSVEKFTSHQQKGLLKALTN